MGNLNNHPLAGKKDIDSAFSGIWSFYKQWFKPLYLISFIMAVITGYVSSRIDLSTIQDALDINEIMSFLKSVSGIIALQFLISLFFNILIQYFVIFRPLDENFNIIDAAGTVFVKFYFPLMLIYILLGIFAFVALMAGAVLLFVGIFFAIPYVMLFFTMVSPLLIIEKKSIGEIFPSLFKLVHKRFWPNMAWISVFIILLILFSLIVNLIVSLPFSGSMFGSITDPSSVSNSLETAKNPLYIIVSSLASALTAPLMPILGLLLYFNNSDNNKASGIDHNSNNGGDVKVEDLYSDNQNDDYSPSVEDLAP